MSLDIVDEIEEKNISLNLAVYDQLHGKIGYK